MEWLKPEDVAEAIAFTVSQPKRVNLQTITIMLTGQGACRPCPTGRWPC
jgi:NADP-dependent 3-hydroxy acid dehydrogenase YdfG